MSIPALVGAVGGPAALGTDIVEPAFAQETSSGNLLVAFACSIGDGSESFPLSISDDSWTLAVSGGYAYTWGALYYKADCGADETAPSFSDSPATAMGASLAEFSGAATSSPLDQTGATVGDPVTASAVDSAVDDLVIALVLWNGANAYPNAGFQIYGSDGNGYSTNWMSFNQGIDAEYPPFWVFANNASGPSTLGTYANKAAASISEFENSPVELIASFKAA